VGETHAQKCKHLGKAPCGSWKEFQTRLPTEAELRRKWEDNPQLNVGMTLGGVTGLVGLDVDEAGGEELLRRRSGGDLPPTLEFTSGKGRRLLYHVPEGVELRPTPRPGGEEVKDGELRLLGLGSQTVMPPSRHKDSAEVRDWFAQHLEKVLPAVRQSLADGEKAWTAHLEARKLNPNLPPPCPAGERYRCGYIE
jgi:Bifunctional DNA primase/polymerase, N-terminal